MFGCLSRIGCGLLLIVLGAVGWATKDRWWPEVRRRLPIEVPAVRGRGSVVVQATDASPGEGRPGWRATVAAA